MQDSIQSTSRFEVDGVVVTFAAGIKRQKPVVVFGIYTGLEAVPVFSLDKKWQTIEGAIHYVQHVSVVAAEKFLAHYQEHYQAMTEQVNRVFAREHTGFIAPDTNKGRFPSRGCK